MVSTFTLTIVYIFRGQRAILLWQVQDVDEQIPFKGPTLQCTTPYHHESSFVVGQASFFHVISSSFMQHVQVKQGLDVLERESFSEEMGITFPFIYEWVWY